MFDSRCNTFVDDESVATQSIYQQFSARDGSKYEYNNSPNQIYIECGGILPCSEFFLDDNNFANTDRSEKHQPLPDSLLNETEIQEEKYEFREPNQFSPKNQRQRSLSVMKQSEESDIRPEKILIINAKKI